MIYWKVYVPGKRIALNNVDGCHSAGLLTPDPGMSGNDELMSLPPSLSFADRVAYTSTPVPEKGPLLIRNITSSQLNTTRILDPNTL